MGRLAARKLGIVALCVGALAALIAVVVPFIIQHQVDAAVQTQTAFTPTNTGLLSAFSHHTESVSIWIHNITNPSDVLNGAKPFIDEIGPLVYTAETERFDLHFAYDNSDLKYKEWTRYIPANPLAASLQNETVTSINMPFQRFAGNDADGVYANNNYTDMDRLFTNRTIREVLFGYNDTMLSAIQHITEPFFSFPAWYSGLITNHSSRSEADGVLGHARILTGRHIPQLTGEVESWDGMASLNCCLYGTCGPTNRGGFREAAWGAEEANQFGGTFGFNWVPGMPTVGPPRMFLPEMFRSVDLEDEGHVMEADVHLRRYHLPDSIFQSSATNPSNAVYYANGPDGLVNITRCQSSARMFVSKPHFLGGDPQLIQNLTNFDVPNPSYDDSFDVEPITGTTFRKTRRWQINTFIQPTPANDILSPGALYFPNIRPTYVPLAWVEREYRLPYSRVHTLKDEVYNPLHRKTLFTVVGACVAGVFGIAGVVLLIIDARRRRMASSSPLDDLSNSYIRIDTSYGTQ